MPFEKEKRNRRQQCNKIIHGNLAEFWQEQVYGKCEK
jgi:hypothetical protein